MKTGPNVRGFPFACTRHFLPSAFDLITGHFTLITGYRRYISLLYLTFDLYFRHL